MHPIAEVKVQPDEVTAQSDEVARPGEVAQPGELINLDSLRGSYRDSWHRFFCGAGLYDDMWYIGEILQFDEDNREYQISFLKAGSCKSAYSFKWP